MENTLGQVAQIAAMGAAIFFALLASNGLLKLYQRFDDLLIDRTSTQVLARRSGVALAWAGISGLFHYLPFFMASGMLLCGMVLFQVMKNSGLLKNTSRF